MPTAFTIPAYHVLIRSKQTIPVGIFNTKKTITLAEPTRRARTVGVIEYE